MRGGILKKKIFSLLLIVILTAAFIAGCMMPQAVENNETNGGADEKEQAINEDGKYTSAEEVAVYIRTYGRLPSNFITKKEAMALGWNSEKGNLWDVTDRMSIGGDSFGNREGALPKKEGRKWFECDINYEGGYRVAERIVYSNDGLIYYTNDHYKTFVQLY
ncbi:MAG TPA: ribonuclease [Clostridiales bacterium]|nr:ribonuclease [Clostridiales bacterium]